MKILAKCRMLWSSIVMLAILFSSIAPTISYALVVQNNAVNNVNLATAEICTMSGHKFAKQSASENSNKPIPAKKAMQHCAFCATHDGSYALPSAPMVAAVFDFSRNIYPPLFYTAPHALHAWLSANPRGPPVTV